MASNRRSPASGGDEAAWARYQFGSWRLGAIAGALVSAVDAGAFWLIAAFKPGREMTEIIGVLDQLATFVGFYALGLAIARAGGHWRNGLEAGIVAGSLVGLVSALVSAAFPDVLPHLDQDPPRSLAASIATNYVMNVLTGALLGWIAVRFNPFRPVNEPPSAKR